MEDDTHSFIIRIWNAAEGPTRSSSTWRGSIDYVGSDKRLYFNDLESIAAFIHEQVGFRNVTFSAWHAMVNFLQDIRNSLSAWVRR